MSVGAEDAFAVIFKQCQGLASSDGFRCAPALPAEATSLEGCAGDLR